VPPDRNSVRLIAFVRYIEPMMATTPAITFTVAGYAAPDCAVTGPIKADVATMKIAASVTDLRANEGIGYRMSADSLSIFIKMNKSLQRVSVVL
jgi:hypothetical protein